MKQLAQYLFISVSILLFTSCNQKTESNMSMEDIMYIRNLFPFEEGENIQFFDTNGGLQGLRTAGSFISDRRIGTYWMKGEEDKHHLLFSEIDSIVPVDKTNAATLASYLHVYGKDGTQFKVYIDADKTRTKEFFDMAMRKFEQKPELMPRAIGTRPI